ncbi:MAG: hypothetical protein D6723_11225 [Acidobacteria bacterium]|nr:MAG: hypothetical protein D6723_11225 [Acidobacteriota bacterium]
MTPVRIDIVPVGRIAAAVVEYLQLVLPETLNLPCRLRHATIDIRRAYDDRRRQYRSREILTQLADLDEADEVKILGVTDVDLFIPVLTFVFGEAQLGGRAAVVSVHRLRQEFYGLPPDEKLFLERCEKEALHELGHTFGLVHCRRLGCVMHFSNSIAEVDLKSSTFCPSCARRLP